MAKKRVKKKVSKNNAKAEDYNAHCCKSHSLFAKLSAMAFILFLITAWPNAMKLAHGIHWGWFLGATFLFIIIAHTRFFGCCKR